MAKNISQQGLQQNKTDAVLTDYLDDMFGGSEPVSDEQDGACLLQDTRSLQESAMAGLSSASTIGAGHRLITTLDVKALLSSDKPSGGDAFLLALSGLYYLRRPVPNRLRQFLLQMTESMLDSYVAASWQDSLSKKGVMRETRQR